MAAGDGLLGVLDSVVRLQRFVELDQGSVDRLAPLVVRQDLEQARKLVPRLGRRPWEASRSAGR